jgi:hypothetical protein
VILHDGLPAVAEGEAGGTLLSGVVRDPDSGAPVVEARVSLAGTLLESVTDSSGTFLLGGIPRGDYQVEVRTPWLDSIGTVHRASVRVSGVRRRLEVTLPPAAALVAAACGTRRDGGVLVGRVRTPPRGPVAGTPDRQLARPRGAGAPGRHRGPAAAVGGGTCRQRGHLSGVWRAGGDGGNGDGGGGP